MLRLCSKEEFDIYVDFAYELASDAAKSGYPTYCDGVKTKAMFIEHSLKAFERETEQMLLFELEGKVQGLIHFFWIPKDLYLETCLFLINKETGQALSEFLTFARERFPGYDLFMGFPADNHAAVNHLAEQGFECIEDDYNNTSFLDRIGCFPENKDVVRINKDNYKLFQILHSQTDDDMYWNCERIYDALDRWVVLIKEEDGKPKGAVYYWTGADGWFEIFGIDIDQDVYDRELVKELLQAALSDAKQRNGKVMTFFCDEEYEKVAVECGLECVGKYLCFKTVLN